MASNAAKHSSRLSIKKICLICIGFTCILLGAIGIILPVLPTTPFILLAAICFAKSSERFYQLLLQHAYFGQLIRNWQQKRCISRNNKLSAIICIMLFGCGSVLWLPTLISKIATALLLMIGLSCMFFIKTCNCNEHRNA